MRAKRELLNSLRILDNDCLQLLAQFSNELVDTDVYTEEDFCRRWDKLRREVREVARSIYEEHQRFTSLSKKIE
jgi:hypothetical protein